ncbi:hypothetical protein K1719_033474 [Acacia pycnantha]|nr:hypothetical protein K1719_033474 [Acacia pycnantha]
MFAKSFVFYLSELSLQSERIWTKTQIDLSHGLTSLAEIKLQEKSEIRAFRKSYRSKEKHKYRFNIFKVNLHQARRHQNLDPIAVHSVTLFSDMTPSEFRKVLGLRGLKFPVDVNKAANQCSSPVALIGEAVKTDLKIWRG